MIKPWMYIAQIIFYSALSIALFVSGCFKLAAIIVALYFIDLFVSRKIVKCDK